MDFLCFSNDAEREYAVNIADLIAITTIENITSVPGTFNYIKGIFIYHNEIIPIIDLQHFCYDEPCSNDNNLVVILQGNQEKYGLLINTVGKIVRGNVPEDIRFLDSKDFERTIKSGVSPNNSTNIELF